MQATHFESGGRYPVLRTLGILALVGAFMATIGGVLTAGWALFYAPETVGTRVIYALLALSATFFTVVMIIAAAEGLKLIMDIERNTRAYAYSRTMTTVPTPTPTDATAGDGVVKAGGRLQWLEGEETAEGALLRGH
jgi:hypothetical protein